VREVVADASILIDVLVARSPTALTALDDAVIHAPHLTDVEVLQALRRLHRAGTIEHAVAVGARAALLDVVTHRYPHDVLLDRVWELRANLTAYDATYVALAEALGLPLLTCDRRIASAPGLRCAVELE
jgi:predicted nucleic acid-binding protein